MELEREQKIMIGRILTSGLLLGAGLLQPEEGMLRFLLCAAAWLIAGADVLLRAVKNILHGDVFDENFLMGAASVGALILGESPEAAAVMVFYQVGELFQDIAVDRSRASIASLMDIRPDHANLEENGALREVDPAAVPAGSVIVVKPGERVPLDGFVLEGTSSLDTSALTGESLPRDVASGDTVVSGCVNQSWWKIPKQERRKPKNSSPVFRVFTPRRLSLRLCCLRLFRLFLRGIGASGHSAL